jgi:hypothetical protein
MTLPIVPGWWAGLGGKTPHEHCAVAHVLAVETNGEWLHIVTIQHQFQGTGERGTGDPLLKKKFHQDSSVWSSGFAKKA